MSALAAGRAVRIDARPRVDLLPRAEAERRERRALARRWAFVVLAALVVTVAACGGAFAMSVVSQFRLQTQQLETQRVLTDLQQVSGVSAAIAERSAIQALEARALAGDFSWAQVLDALRAELPPAVSLSAFELEAGPAPTGGDSSATAGLGGIITLETADPSGLVIAIENLRTAPHTLELTLQSTSNEEGVTSATLAVLVDQSFYRTNAGS